MRKPRPIEVLGPAVLSLGVLLAVGIVRDFGTGSSAYGMDPPLFTQSATSLPGGNPGVGDPPVFLNAGTQRIEQLSVMREILVELRAIREMLQSGGVTVNVDEVDLDYDRLAETLSGAMPAGKAGASRGSGLIEGGVRRITRADESSDEETSE